MKYSILSLNLHVMEETNAESSHGNRIQKELFAPSDVFYKDTNPFRREKS